MEYKSPANVQSDVTTSGRHFQELVMEVQGDGGYAREVQREVERNKGARHRSYMYE